MERTIIMGWTKGKYYGLQDAVAADARGYVCCIEAYPKYVSPYVRNGVFDFSAYFRDVVTVLFQPDRRGYIAAYRWLRVMLREGCLNQSLYYMG